MKKVVLILCILGFTSLIVGSVLAFADVRNSVTITSYGTIRYPENSTSLPDAEEYQAVPLWQIGYLTIFVSIGFFTVAFLDNRKST